MTASVYDQHRASFANVSAFVILDTQDASRPVATIAIKFPRDGAGRLYAYVHWIGNEMVRGFANGYGYDKRSAAMSSAAGRYLEAEAKAAKASGEAPRPERDARKLAFWKALEADRGSMWDSMLRDAGFQVVAAV